MKRAEFAVALFWLAAFVAPDAVADIAFPARLDVAEREPGVFDIGFTLPVVEGRVLRAQPLMPPTCRDLTPRVDGTGADGFTSTWSVHCEPPSLAGEAIIVEGLLGTQTDLALTLTMLDGRTYSRILRPSRPGFLVPRPPTFAGLAAESIRDGLRRTLGHFNLWALCATAALLGARRRTQAAAVVAFATGHCFAQWLGGLDWLLVSPLVRDAFTWAAAAAGCVRLAGGAVPRRGRIESRWATAFLLGLLFGGVRAGALTTDGLSNAEQLESLFLFAIGTAAAVTVMVVAAGEFRAVLETAAGGRWRATATRIFGYAAGAAAVGMCLVQLVGLMVSAGDGSRVVLALALFAAVIASTAAWAGWRQEIVEVSFAVLATAGAAFALNSGVDSLSTLVGLAAVLALAAALATGRPLPNRVAVVAVVAATPALAWSIARFLADNVSRSNAVTGGAILTAACVLHASLTAVRPSESGSLAMPARVMGAAIAILAVGWRLAEYRSWYELEIATEAALGVVRIPLLALVLAVLAAATWPRRRRVAREFGIESHKTNLNWIFLGAAFLLLPFGTATVNNPFFAREAPRGNDARLVVSRVLSDTYHAFNIADEDSLYERLTESVTGDLVDDLFLDSRRRLTTGTREGTDVTIRDVGVLSIGEPLAGFGADGAFSYECRWEVIARVRHLQHIHHRQNIYNGILTLRPEDGRWKIAQVDLTSEDRAVVAWKPS